MNVSVMLDVAIGLVIVYISTALIVSAIQELIASLLQWRSQHLKESILQLMLCHDATGLNETKHFRDQIYENPLIQSMNHSAVSVWSRLTSHFVFHWQKKSESVGDEKEDEQEKAYEKLYLTSSPSYIEPEIFAIALVNELQKNTLPFETFQELITFLESPETQNKIPQALRDTLLMLANNAKIKINAGENALLSFQKEIENWFHTSMKRAGGIYKRNTQLVCFLLALIITIFLNLDTFYISQILLNNSILRTTLANNAVQLVNNFPTDNNSPLDVEQLQENVSKIFSNSLPIAPIYENVTNFMDCQQQNSCSIQEAQPNLRKFLSALCGWIVTTLAVFMGAPFWFDLLGQLVNVRANGSKPNRS
ncbi:hypothetical protein [Nodularia sp. UHCC 0506]|uniref:hypothetical protein n=1 Tax=Nodularia sp. UHCC 0506 TaxID=3110243 RepID=UPI002B2156E5|nr:hypothetical protein [Nodularia sp. UHCC 0506]MEA5515815.1 hypothetical protein [Nodularia sp. UHCC 0506]